MIRKTVLIVIIIAITLPAVSGIVAADDKWPDRCHHQMRMLGPGQYSGTLSPSEYDYLKFDIPEGDFATVRAKTSSAGEDNRMSFSTPTTGTITDTDGTKLEPDKGPDPVINKVGRYGTKINVFPGKFKFRLYSEHEGPLCVSFATLDDQAGEWQISVTFSDETPPPIGGGSQDAVKTITALKSTITEQKKRINELEAQLQKGGGITIQVTVNPEGDSQSFVQGESAVVSAKSSNADLSKMQVRYKGNTYSVDDSGKAAIPLTQAGEQKLTFAYQGVTKSVTLSVASRGQDSFNATAGGSSDGDIIPVSGPGFGSVPALIAIIIGVLGFGFRIWNQ